MLRAPCLFDVDAEGVVGDDAVDVADVAFLDHGADLDGEREEARPDGFHEEEVFGLGGFDEFPGLRGVGREGFFAEDGLSREEAEHGVLVVVGVRGGDVDDVDVGVFHELVIGAVGGGRGGAVAGLEEFAGAVGGGGGGCGGDGVLDVVDVAGGRVEH